MGTKPVRIDNRKRQKARRRRQTAAARAAVLAAALVLVAVLVVAGIIRHHKKTQTVQILCRVSRHLRQKQPEKHLQAHRYRV